MSFLISLVLVVALPLDTDVDADPTKGDIILGEAKREEPKRQAPSPSPVADRPEEAPMEPETGTLLCRTEGPFPQDDECVIPTEPTDAPDAEVTPGQVLSEVKRIGLPRLAVVVQPPGSTLVNLETIFHTRVEPFERTVTILDSTVVLRAVPTAFTWRHGDGTSQTSTRPGRPYPAMDVIHRYRRTGQVHASVDVTYRVSYRIDGGDWQELSTVITATGPATELRVREARPVLVR